MRIDHHSKDLSPRRWQRPALIASAAALGILVLFHETLWSMVLIWWGPSSYTHGFLIFPISVWLIWHKRHQLVSLKPEPEFKVLRQILLTGCCWLLAHLLGVQFVEELALVGLLVLTVWCVLGTAVFKVLLFPLGFLFFAVPPVPIHDALVLPMMESTADIAVTLIQLTGISVYREGTTFSIPSGNWSVIAACSGTQYLLASIVIGSLFAHLAYRNWRRRLAFMGFAIVLPIVANGLRVYMTVMIGHLSGMRLAVSVDHVFYGLLFFGLIIMVMFLVGSLWRESREDISCAQTASKEEIAFQHGFSTRNRFVGAGLAALLAATIWPGIASSINQTQVADNRINPQIPSGIDGWRIEDERLWAWWPRVQRVDGEFYKFYRRGNQVVSLYVGQFRRQRRGVELVDLDNVVVVPNHPGWQANRRNDLLTVGLKNRKLHLIQSTTDTLNRGRPGWQRLLIWHWYRLGDRYTSNPLVAKWLGLWSRLTGGRQDAALIVMATPYDEDLDAGANVMRTFAENMLPAIESALDRSLVEGQGI